MTNQSTADDLISFAEAGRIIGKTRDTIRRWVNDGLIPFTTMPSGLRMVRKSDIAALLKVHKKANATPIQKPQTETA